ncbi:packaged DNA stabilization protein [Serratia ureilytica]|uniref:packaged DNA stabilization protein n=1 Tax=Serratia ureilytica TaxID=300181 RepID=UPI003851730C
MPIQKLPLAKGLGKDYRNADYVDFLPVNMLATPKEVLNASGYLRSFPGVAKRSDVSGVSRGVEYNTVQNIPYRVAGGKIYRGGNERGNVAGDKRVSMAHSATSQAVAANGIMTLYRYDGTNKTLDNWPPNVGGTDFAQYDIGSVRDICRARGRYVWVKDGTQSFGVTDLEDESHPDRFRPFYTAESQPDGIIGCGVWRDFVVMFGSSTIEYFSLTGAADTSAAIYVAQPSLMVQKGIAGTYCKTEFMDSFAFISHQSTGAPSIYMINNGQASQIATATVEKVLRSYTADELATGVLESIRFDSHELLIAHLPRHVLCYDATASQSGPQWCILKTGLFDDVHRAIDYVFEGNQVTVGDKLDAVTGALKFDSSAQYDKQAEHLLFTPMFKADNARVFDFELESATGVSQWAERLFISATVDGSNYGREQMVDYNAPFIYDKRAIWRRVGRVRKNIGFKVRVITRSPVTLSDCSLRIE